MRTILKHGTLGALFILLLLCSCATKHSIRSQLPREVVMNPGAGRGQHLFVTLRLESGEELPFVVDTGAAWTHLDKSLVPKLGKPLGRLTTDRFGVKTESAIYAAPKLYLGSTPLQIEGGGIADYDLKQVSGETGPPILGVLGMDCLRHYCIQLDFTANRVRFFDTQHSKKQDWGKAFPLTDHGDGRPVISESLAGVKGAASLIDTGCNVDGWLATNLFQQWTNQAQPPANGEARSPNAVLGGETYPEILNLQVYGDCNGIGLSFLARHLVTFDFPNQTMYLKRTSVGPLVPEYVPSARKFLKNLLRKGRLPGWPKGSEGMFVDLRFHNDLPWVTYKMQKDGDSSYYYYQVDQPSKDGRWKLQKAWRTDQNDCTLEQYPVP